MRSSVLTGSTAAALLASISRGHIVLENPKPYVFAEYGPSNPINPNGSNWPCKIPSGVTKLKIDGAPTTMVIGEKQKASFTGSAVHGGGSCQFALTPGFEPTKDSVFKVIHSIEGGCVKTNILGNLEEGESPDTFEFDIPDGIAEGEYTFSWSWQARIGGQPEYYQNCAPIVVKAAAGSGSRAAKARQDKYATEKWNSLPGVFMANMGETSGECDTSDALREQIPIAYPHPGDSVSHPEGTDNLFKQPCDGNLINNGAAPADPPAQSTRAPSATTPASTTASAAASTSTQANTETVAPPEATTSATSVPTPAPTSTATSTTDVKTTPSATETQSAGEPAPTGACTEGYLLCSGTTFSTCTGGKWTAPVPLAEGTYCAPIGKVGVGLKIINPY